MTRRTSMLTVITAAVLTLVLSRVRRGRSRRRRRGRPGPHAAVRHRGNGPGPSAKRWPGRKNVEQSSGGTLKIEFVTEYAPGDPHRESQVIADVRSGAIDLGRVGARAFDVNGYDEFQPLLAPVPGGQLRTPGQGVPGGHPRAGWPRGSTGSGCSRWACFPVNSAGS